MPAGSSKNFGVFFALKCQTNHCFDQVLARHYRRSFAIYSANGRNTGKMQKKKDWGVIGTVRLLFVLFAAAVSYGRPLLDSAIFSANGRNTSDLRDTKDWGVLLVQILFSIVRLLTVLFAASAPEGRPLSARATAVDARRRLSVCFERHLFFTKKANGGLFFSSYKK